MSNSLDCSPPGSSVHLIFQARILEWDAISSSRESSQLRDQTHVSCVSCIGRQILYQVSHLGSPAAAVAAKSLQLCPILCDPHRGQPTRLPRPLDSPYKFKQKFQLPWIIFSVNKWRDWIGVNGIYNHFHLGKRNFYFTFVSKEKILLLLPFKNHPYLHMASALPSWYFIILFHTYCMNKNTRLVIDSEWLKVNKLT